MLEPYEPLQVSTGPPHAKPQVLRSEAIKVKKPPSGNALDGSSVEVAIVAGVGAMEIARTVAIVAMEIGALVAKTVNGTGSKTATSHDIQEEQRLNGHLGIPSCARGSGESKSAQS